MGSSFGKTRRNTAGFTDERIRTMTEVLSGIKVIKMYSWEKPFADMVQSLREKEVKSIKWFCFLRAINMSLSFVTTRVIIFSCFVTHILRGFPLKADAIFVTLALFNTLRITLTLQFPQAVSTFFEALVSCKRITSLLVLENVVNSNSIAVDNPVETRFVHIDKLTSYWDPSDDDSCLENINLQVNQGDLMVIIGSTGSGKTSLLLAILDEIHNKTGRVIRNGTISYASQEIWSFNASIRENILFGQPFNPERYKRVLAASTLERDIMSLPFGDSTLVGERGIGLSGGQRARVSLARAIYREADIYLLDDPLSAVDAHVANLIFERCIRDFLSGKAVLLVTHQIQFLQKASKIVLMHDGKATLFNSLTELQAAKVDLVSEISKETAKSKLIKAKRARKRAEKQRKSKDVAHSPVNSTPSRDSTASQLSVGSMPMGAIDIVPIMQPSPEVEQYSRGTVKTKVYWAYLKSGANCFLGLATLATNILSQVFFTSNDLWLSNWTDSFSGSLMKKFRDNLIMEWLWSRSPVGFYSLPIMDFESAGYRSDVPDSQDPNLTYNIGIYSSLIIGLFVTSILRSTLLFRICNNASINLHNVIFYRVLRSPMSLFESNPIGRILNRFSRDLSIIDELLPSTAFDLILNSFTAIGCIFVIAYVSPSLIIPAIFLLISVLALRKFYIRSGRDIKRLESVARSPVYSLIQSIVEGIVTIRSYKVEDLFCRRFEAHLNDHSGTWFTFICASRALGVFTDYFCLLYIIIVTTVIVTITQDNAPGEVGVALSSVVILIGLFQWSVRQSAEFESQMTAVERVIEYTEIETEAPPITDVIPPATWPDSGAIEFEHVSLKYPSAIKPTLEDINITIKPKEKIGVVGRTGAGKSSLLSCLFRIVEPKGSITIDKVNIMSLGLDTLRKKISIIPQEAVLFAGTIRYNLDPFKEHSDAEIWEALGDVQLRETVDEFNGKLEYEIREGGSNFSVGQRQLVCLARALLRNNKILVIDEATANVDYSTDLVIQNTIRTKFSECTTLTIAHRLNTIIDSDRVLVLDAGQVAEFDSPFNLLKDKSTLFSKLVSQTGKAMARKLRHAADEFEKARQRGVQVMFRELVKPKTKTLPLPNQMISPKKK
ncbi:ATP-binding cassette sub-family C member 4-like isoform X2 [Panonychus citri]|nr:ATP-binding cassette sub-family C member 4-like isoform X2 [Panonychus citri]XP_053204850.1 ATP-binding cassette sub-family C member 4-like isoform X2 [Panonychus citri]XP_053213309.1 ATP-binding cassette sub-family C member 4-like isoform X2 [Panonychus citri]